MQKSKLPLSAFIICLNEEAYIENCIKSLGACGEIIIVDSGSKDKTLEIVKKYKKQGWPIKLIHNDWPGYAAQKQFALDQCTKEWCLNIDADERLDEALQNELEHLLSADADIVGWRIARRPYLIGFGYTPQWAKERKNLRLIRNGKGEYDLSLKVHEGITPNGTVKPSKKGSLLHFRPLPIEEQILKENKYSSLKSEMNTQKGRSPSLLKLIFNPPVYFLRLYLKTGLWRCGVPGFTQAMYGAIYAFMTEAKMFEIQALKNNPPKDDA
ncbi:MAG: glycosyltransferase family 2 protein [Nitratireductor sp.]